MARLRELNALWRYAHVVLSPHLDDAVLSLGSTIAAWSAGRERVLIYTLCAGLPSPLDELSAIAEELTGGGAHQWVRARREEDARAAELVGADHAFGTALDAIFRAPERYAAYEQLFGAPDPSDSLRAHAFAMISVIVAFAAEAKIYAPLAIGGHVDHRIIREAAERAVPAERLAFFEDFPYLLKENRPTNFVPLPGARRVTRKKEAAIASYTSQLRNLFGTPAKMRRAIRAQKKEILWRPLSG